MFTIVPLIIIFLCSSYIYLNDVSMIVMILIYLFEIGLVIGTFFLYKKIKLDLKDQEQNKIKQEIYNLKQKVSNTNDEILKKSLENKIINLEQSLK